MGVCSSLKPASVMRRRMELITRERSEADGRAVVVTLTDAGGAALDAALPDHLETERGMLAGLSAAEQQQLSDLLRRFLVALGRVPQDP